MKSFEILSVKMSGNPLQHSKKNLVPSKKDFLGTNKELASFFIYFFFKDLLS